MNRRSLQTRRDVRALLTGLSAGLMVLTLGIFPTAHPTANAPAETVNRTMSLTADTGGQLWAAWEVDEQHDGDVYYSYKIGHQWQPPQPLSSDPEAWEGSPSLTLAADGTLWAAWWVSPEPDHSNIQISHWTGDHWAQPQEVPGTAALLGRQPVLAAAPDGGLWLAWIGNDGTDREVFASRWNGLAWSTPQQVGSNDTDPLAYDTQPRLVVNNRGQAWLLWVSHEGPLNDEIHASYWDGRHWSSQYQVNSSDDMPDVWPAVALDASGQPWVAWQGVAGEQEDRWRIFLSTWDAAEATWGAESMVSSPLGLEVDEERPGMAFSSDGQLNLVWVVSGALSGIAAATWDGSRWTPATWTGTADHVQAPVVLAEPQLRFFWLARQAGARAPITEKPLDQTMAPMPLSSLLEQASPSAASEIVPNRYLAHGDSITLGGHLDGTGQPSTPYPTLLEARLNGSSGPSEVINSGKPGEKARAARERLKSSLIMYQPQAVLIMEGTNDVKDYSPSETGFAVRNLVVDAKATVPGIQIVAATVIPRLDEWAEDIALINVEIRKWVQRENVPLADQWQAYVNYGPYDTLYVDPIHPNTAGQQIIADTFFQTLVDAGFVPNDTTPPTAQIAPLPAQSECTAVSVAWSCDDGGGSAACTFDVQTEDNGGPWTNWLTRTSATAAIYSSAPHGHTLGFRVRASDAVGNIGAYSSAASTLIVDNTAPEAAGIGSLPLYRTAPFSVSWWGQDACGATAKYDVEYRIGTGTWVRWFTRTTDSSAVFDPDSLQCGQGYYFRARAFDSVGNGPGPWSDGSTSTILACSGISGSIRNVREAPIYHAKLSTTPNAMWTYPSDAAGLYGVYLNSPGDYDVAVERAGFGTLPPRWGLTVAGSMADVDFYLPPVDDRVNNGGFESGDWGAWKQAGSNPPTRNDTAHTGQSAALLEAGNGGSSRLSQSVAVSNNLTHPTLSLMVRLANPSGPAGTLEVRVEGSASINDELSILPGDWIHAWYDLSPLVGQKAEVTLTVAGGPAVIVDEVSLGSALPGVHWAHLPLVANRHSQALAAGQRVPSRLAEAFDQ